MLKSELINEFKIRTKAIFNKENTFKELIRILS